MAGVPAPFRLGSVFAFLLSASSFAQELQLHYINVGWGGAVLVVGPDGTTVLLEAGDTGKGASQVVPYLQSIGITTAMDLDYTIIGHQHCDHNGGMDEVVQAGYDVLVRNYTNGSSYSSTCVTQWNSTAATTSAGATTAMPVGTVIPLGFGATLTCIARNGSIIGGGSVSVSDENDRSIAVLVKYGGFDWIWASDMGGGNIDTTCTGRSTSQTDVETAVLQAISPGGAFPLISAGGVDVLHINHHGSESSTNNNWKDLADPEVCCISTGAGQSSSWNLPRVDVVDHVCMGTSTGCVSTGASLVLQTEEGSPTGSLTSFSGFCVGDIVIRTTGSSTMTISANGQVNQGPNEVVAAGLPRTIALDDAGGGVDLTPPANPTGLAATAGNARVDLVWNANAEADLAGYDVFRSNAAAGPFTKLNATILTTNAYANTGLTNGSTYYYVVTALDVSGNASGGSNTVSATPVAPPVVTPWINEFHYDNNGTDTNEFVEIAGAAGTNLAAWTLVGYDGSGGASYKTVSLSGTLASQQNGFGTRSFAFSGLQNGSPDGIALVNASGLVVQFLSYEGVFTATNGPAVGLLSTNLRQSEASNTPNGRSLRLTGTGCNYASFVWQPPAASSAGAVNAGQSFSLGCP